MRSNGACTRCNPTLELQVLRANPFPVNDDIHAEGNTARHIELDEGSVIDVGVFIPRARLSSGKDVDGGKELLIQMTSVCIVAHIVH